MSNEIKIKTSVDNTGTKKGLKETENLVKKSSKDIANEFKTLGKGVGDAFNSFKTGDIKGGFDGLSKSLGGLSTGAMAAAAGIAAIGVAAVATTDYMKKLIDQADKIGEGAARVGMTGSEYQKLGKLAQQAGMDIESFAKGMKKAQINQYEAINGNKSLAETYNKLGVSLVDVNGNQKDANRVNEETLLALSKIENVSERSALGVKIFGKSFQEMSPLIEQGESKLKSFIATSGGMVVFSDKVIAASGSINDSLEDIGTSFKKGIVSSLEPQFERINEFFIKIKESGDFEEMGRSIGLVIKVITEGMLFAGTAINNIVQALKMAYFTMIAGFVQMVQQASDIVFELVMAPLRLFEKINEFLGLKDGAEFWNGMIKGVEGAQAKTDNLLSSINNEFIEGTEKAASNLIDYTALRTAEEKKITKVKSDENKKTEKETEAAREKRLKEEQAYVDKIKEYADQNQINLWSSDKKVVDGVAVDKTPEEIKKDQLSIIDAKYTAELDKIRALEAEDTKRGTNKFNDAAELAKAEMAWIIERSNKEQSLDKETADKAKRLADENVAKQKEQQKTQEDAMVQLGGTAKMIYESLVPENFKEAMGTIKRADRPKIINSSGLDRANFGVPIFDDRGDNVVDATIDVHASVARAIDNLLYQEYEEDMKKIKENFSTMKEGAWDTYKELKGNLGEEPISREEWENNYKRELELNLDAVHGIYYRKTTAIGKDINEKLQAIVIGTPFIEKMYGKLDKETPFVERLFGTKEAIDKTISYISTIGSTAMDYFGALNDLSNAKLQQDLDNKAKAHESELSGLRLTNRAKVREEQKYQKEVDKLKEAQKEKDKKFKIANVWMNFASGMMSAWSTSMQFGPIAGPIFGAVMTGLLTATALKQVELINKYQDGGIVPGASYSGDKVPAMVNSGEMILNSGQQRRLFDIANGGGSNQPTQIVINGNVTQDHLQELEDMLYKLNSRSRLSFIGGR